MDAMATSQPLAEVDINAGSTQELIVGSEKKNRNIWKEQHKIALVNQLYLDECCPIGKRTHKEVNAAWTSLVRALRDRGDGLFDEFDLSIPTLRRQMKELMRRQKELNREAITATGLGGARMHTDLEAGAQHLLELQDCVDATRASEKEGKASKLARLDGYAQEALKRSMATHGKRPRRSGGSGSGSGRSGRRASGSDFAEKVEAAEEFAVAAMESFIERSARMEWLTKMQLHANHPDLAEHPGPENAFVDATLAAHRAKMNKVNTSKPNESPEVLSGSGEMIVGGNT